MSQRLLQRILFMVLLACPVALPAWAASFEVTNVQVSTQADDAVKARDLAITKAQRVAFATLVGRSEDQLAGVSDAAISRLVRGFSVQGERLAARSYAARFTIRFNPNATLMFIQERGFNLVEQETPLMATGAAPGQAMPAAQAETAPAEQTIVVLPVLDIGSRRTLWDEPNPWREIWQKKDMSQPGLSIRVPIGDISDLNDVPDATFLAGGQANMAMMLNRYGGRTAYIVVARHQAEGMLLSLYRHDGKKLQFLRKTQMRPRAGYAFDDAVPAALQMIVMANNNQDSSATDAEASAANPAEMERNALPIAANVPFNVTVPYQSLQQWVGIQKRLRVVQGIKSALPMRVSPSSAQVRMVTSISDSQDLRKNLALQGFDLQQMPGGEIVLIEQQPE